jgi:photosystem II stability/assembly factor-like uncharacterized protein/tetratricopeptide (TPR) repeat protein
MPRLILCLAAGALVASAAAAADLRNFDDAALHAVQFVDANEGWAVGDDGVVWHTIDGGRNWERQPSGVRAGLHSVHFLDPFTGWVAGREELPHNGGSVGVLLVTHDGGLKWERASDNALPGLNRVRFVDSRNGFAVGDGSDEYPGGVFATADGGRTWKPVPGPRATTWLAADFADGRTGILGGAWGRLSVLQQGTLTPADVDPLGGRAVHDLRLDGQRAVAVGQGGLVLVSADSAGARWGYASLGLPKEVQAACDFQAVCGRGEHVWVAGRPGSVVLHSGDQGQTWQTHPTGQPLPLHGLYFHDGQHGWAVGELGCILATTDGGRTWQVQHRGGQRAALLFVHARPTALPAETVAQIGGEEGYLAAAVRVCSPDPTSAAPGRSADGQRLAAAVRMAGGAAGEMLWQFPAAQHLARADRADLLAFWNGLHADRAAELLLRQLVLAIRVWRPDVLVTDNPDERTTGQPGDALLAEAVHEAFARAADPQAFPEQIQVLGLQPWKVGKSYGRWESRAGAQVVLEAGEPSARLEASPRDFATAAAGLLADAPPQLPAQRFFRLLDSRIEGAENHRDLMQGIALTPAGVSRRSAAVVAPLAPEVERALRSSRNLQALLEAPAEGLVEPNSLLAQVEPALKKMPDDVAARAAFRIASYYARLGQWQLAREVYLLLVGRYPTHPLAVDAYRWLIRYSTSSEARRRQELGQYRVATNVETQKPAATGAADIEIRYHAERKPARKKPGETQAGSAGDAAELPPPGPVELASGVRGGLEVTRAHEVTLLGGLEQARQWYRGSLELGTRLAALGPVFAGDPAVQFCLQAARRQLGDVEPARQWYAQFRADHPDGPWGSAAAAELWLVNRSGMPPRPVAVCRQTATRPYLDGQMDDACWQGAKPLALGNAVGDTAKDYPTQAWLAYDKDFLYLALHCRHPADRYVPPVKARPTDADLRPYDRVSLLLDLDRDYSTYFHLQVDQRGCVCDDCWGDLGWNPRWFVAVRSDRDGWWIEAAIPLVELTGEPVTPGRTWACNVVRVLPGRGVQAWSLPADVQPRPEGMGLLMFTAEQPTR